MDRKHKDLMLMVIKIFLSCLTIFFWVMVVRKNYQNFLELDFRIIPLHIVLSGVCFSASIVITGFLWAQVVRRVTDKQVPIWSLTKIHICSWLFRYIPGKVGLIVFKISALSKMEIPKGAILSSIINDYLYLVLSSAVVSLPLIVWIIPELNPVLGIIISVISIISVILFFSNRGLSYKIIQSILKKLGRKPVQPRYFLNPKEILLFSVLYIFPRVVTGIGFILLTPAFVQLNTTEMIYSGAAYVLASVIGLFAFFTPSGIGIREGIAVVLLSSIMSPASAVALSITSRLITTVTDFLISGPLLLTFHIWKKT
jgi:glycosyltransferase 2 family protein